MKKRIIISVISAGIAIAALIAVPAMLPKTINLDLSHISNYENDNSLFVDIMIPLKDIHLRQISNSDLISDLCRFIETINIREQIIEKRLFSPVDGNQFVITIYNDDWSVWFSIIIWDDNNLKLDSKVYTITNDIQLGEIINLLSRYGYL
jgi:hypothetical protein